MSTVEPVEDLSSLVQAAKELEAKLQQARLDSAKQEGKAEAVADRADRAQRLLESVI